MDDQETMAGAYKGNTGDVMLSPVKQVKGLLQEGMKKFTNTQKFFKVGHQGRIMEGCTQLSGLAVVEAAPGRAEQANTTRMSDEKLWKTRDDPDFLQWLRQGSLQQEH